MVSVCEALEIKECPGIDVFFCEPAPGDAVVHVCIVRVRFVAELTLGLKRCSPWPCPGEPLSFTVQLGMAAASAAASSSSQTQPGHVQERRSEFSVNTFVWIFLTKNHGVKMSRSVGYISDQFGIVKDVELWCARAEVVLI